MTRMETMFTEECVLSVDMTCFSCPRVFIRETRELPFLVLYSDNFDDVIICFISCF